MALPQFYNQIEHYRATWENLLELTDWHRYILTYGYYPELVAPVKPRNCRQVDSAVGCNNLDGLKVYFGSYIPIV